MYRLHYEEAAAGLLVTKTHPEKTTMTTTMSFSLTPQRILLYCEHSRATNNFIYQTGEYAVDIVSVQQLPVLVIHRNCRRWPLFISKRGSCEWYTTVAELRFPRINRCGEKLSRLLVNYLQRDKRRNCRNLSHTQLVWQTDSLRRVVGCPLINHGRRLNDNHVWLFTFRTISAAKGHTSSSISLV